MVKEKLTQTLGQHLTPQTQAYLPMLQMMIASMSEERVIAMLVDLRRMIEELLGDGV